MKGGKSVPGRRLDLSRPSIGEMAGIPSNEREEYRKLYAKPRVFKIKKLELTTSLGELDAIKKRKNPKSDK